MTSYRYFVLMKNVRCCCCWWWWFSYTFLYRCVCVWIQLDPLLSLLVLWSVHIQQEAVTQGMMAGICYFPSRAFSLVVWVQKNLASLLACPFWFVEWRGAIEFSVVCRLYYFRPRIRRGGRLINLAKGCVLHFSYWSMRWRLHCTASNQLVLR